MTVARLTCCAWNTEVEKLGAAEYINRADKVSWGTAKAKAHSPSSELMHNT